MRKSAEGFTYVEVLIGATLLLVSLLALCGMFVAGYSSVDNAGNTTMGISAGRQLMEDIRRLPYANLANLNGFDTDDPNSLPASGPEREVARRWRYALAGEGVGWTFTQSEKERWPSLDVQGTALGGVGVITTTALSGTLTQITVTISVPGVWRDIEMSTLIADL